MGDSVADCSNVLRMGLTEVSSPEDPKVDVVLVHGLNGHPYDTWTAKKPEVFWPAQLLPQNVKKEEVRVLVYGYDADVTSFMGGTSKDKIHNHAENLVAKLFANRSFEDATERPIIFVCHSLGGLIVKRALIYARSLRNQRTEHLRSIYVSTYAILFLGTPHNGSDVAKWGSMLQSICNAVLPKSFFNTTPQLVDSLKTENETLQNINRLFTDIMNRFHIYFFHEAKPTDFKGTLAFIVDETSAAPSSADGVERMGIEADHSHMCKFASKTSPGYAEVAEGIKRYARDAPATIAHRWPEEYRSRMQEKRAEAAELFPDSMSMYDNFPGAPPRDTALSQSGVIESTPPTATVDKFSTDQSIDSLPLQKSPALAAIEPVTVASIEPQAAGEPKEPFFVVPTGFRRNSLFYGMKAELKELDRRLFNAKKRAYGTACALVWCLAGGGKSHLVRQYVFANRSRFPGGIFWVYAKSREELHKGFWEIAQAAALKDVEDPRKAVYEEDTAVFTGIMKKWFESRQEWLLVFDGVTIDRDDDVADLQKFIPDSRNSSLVFTSIDKTLVRKQRLLYPVAVRVHPLGEEDAKSLLFRELDIRDPSNEQKEKATEVVRSMDCLPLAIHAIGHRLRATDQPLVKYHIKSNFADPRLAEPYKEIMEDLKRLGYIEARNLINILCWFGQHIPVEMVQLGAKALRSEGVEVRQIDSENRPDLNTTFATLIRFALINRNDPDDERHPQGSQDSLVETIDILKVHSVVQAFCCDTLRKSGELSRWLSLAVVTFCSSYEAADTRIKSKDIPGLISDYRAYEVHGARLMTNIERNLAKHTKLEDAQMRLGSTIKCIQEEIKKATPRSSQESLLRQVSIFNRTSSTSDSANGPETPRHQPTEIETFGPSFDKGQVYSPTTIIPGSPHPAIIDHSPRAPFLEVHPDDVGYDTDRDEAPKIARTTPNLDKYTSIHKASTSEDQDGGWQLVGHSRKKANPVYDPEIDSHRTVAARKQRKRKALSASFRPVFPMVTRLDVNGSLSPSQSLFARGISGSSGAVDSLSAVQRGSPPAPDPAARLSKFDSLNQPPTSSSSQRAYMDVPSRHSNRGSLGLNVTDELVTQPNAHARDFADAKGIEATEILYHAPSILAPIPQANTRMPPHRVTRSVPNDSDPFRPPPFPAHDQRDLGDAPGLHHRIYRPTSDITFPQNPAFFVRSENSGLYQQQPIVPKRNPDSLEVEEDIHVSVNTKLPRSPTFYNRGRRDDRYPLTIYPNGQPHYPPYDLTGYTSQPMSRDASGQSKQYSLADTEPARDPPPLSPYPSSPRGRGADGGPPRKSPKIDYAFPAVPRSMSSMDERVILTDPRSTGQMISGAGDWATQPVAMSMSRSGSGPGFVVARTEAGPIIAKFGSVQFGDQEPVDVREARDRTEKLRRIQASFEEGAYRQWMGRGRGAKDHPYPTYDHMPMGSDSVGVDLQVQGRRRGVSSPTQPTIQGLGLDLGNPGK
ncbi:MAG: hypothetical protein M1827_000089 [Pycnora praestabilis]|nr:MAG: hypothetical protein M1827_000089 [Pycnora praestabilis]